MARYDLLPSYNVDITALANATIVDAHVSLGYAWILTTTHIYRHPLTTGDNAGTVLNIPITSGIGDARRITGDIYTLYVGYSTTSGTIVNTVEERLVLTPATVARTTTLAFNISSEWAGYTGQLAPQMIPITGMGVKDATVGNVLITCANQVGDTGNTFRGAAFSRYSSAGFVHNPDIPPSLERGHYSFDHDMTIDGDDVWFTWYFGAGSFGFWYKRLDARGGATGNWFSQPSNIDSSIETLISQDAGLSASEGVGWLTTADSTDATMTAVQLSIGDPAFSFADPAPPPAPVLSSVGVSDTHLSLFWELPLSVAASYEVRIIEGDAAGGVWQASDSIDRHGFVPVTPDTEYTMQVRASNPYGTGEPLTVTTTTYLLAPRNFRSTRITATTVELAWDAPVYEVESYRISALSFTDFSQLDFDVTGSATTFTVSGLDASTEYLIDIRATATDTKVSGFASIFPTTLAPAEIFDLVPDWDIPLDRLVTNVQDIAVTEHYAYVVQANAILRWRKVFLIPERATTYIKTAGKGDIARVTADEEGVYIMYQTSTPTFYLEKRLHASPTAVAWGVDISPPTFRYQNAEGDDYTVIADKSAGFTTDSRSRADVFYPIWSVSWNGAVQHYAFLVLFYEIPRRRSDGAEQPDISSPGSVAWHQDPSRLHYQTVESGLLENYWHDLREDSEIDVNLQRARVNTGTGTNAVAVGGSTFNVGADFNLENDSTNSDKFNFLPFATNDPAGLSVHGVLGYTHRIHSDGNSRLIAFRLTSDEIPLPPQGRARINWSTGAVSSVFR